MFKNNEYVLIKGLQSGYVVAKVLRPDTFQGQAGYQVQYGMTSSWYSPEAIHKCPKSLWPPKSKVKDSHVR